MASIFHYVRCGLCRTEINWYIRSAPAWQPLGIHLRRWRRSWGRWRSLYVLRGWTLNDTPFVWLCPGCARAEHLGRRLSLYALGLDVWPSAASAPPRGYWLLHALSVVFRFLRNGWV